MHSVANTSWQVLQSKHTDCKGVKHYPSRTQHRIAKCVARLPRNNKRTTDQKAEGTRRTFWMCGTGTGQQVALIVRRWYIYSCLNVCVTLYRWVCWYTDIILYICNTVQVSLLIYWHYILYICNTVQVSLLIYWHYILYICNTVQASLLIYWHYIFLCADISLGTAIYCWHMPGHFMATDSLYCDSVQVCVAAVTVRATTDIKCNCKSVFSSNF